MDALMQGESAGAVITDPPYGINREGIENDDPEVYMPYSMAVYLLCRLTTL
jgi:tRNA G10  N-methylase Trm11